MYERRVLITMDICPAAGCDRLDSFLALSILCGCIEIEALIRIQAHREDIFVFDLETEQITFTCHFYHTTRAADLFALTNTHK